MLRTALRPAWIAGLILALVVSGVFVLLGKWQMDNAASAPPPLTQTETPVPLTSHFQPGQAMYGTEADQVVTLSGTFLPDTDVYVFPRLNEDEETGVEGYWVVSALRVDGAPDGEVIPVVRGWVGDPAGAEPVPTGRLDLTGRLLPAEGPAPEGLERTADGTVLANLATAELVNVWDQPSYAGYVAAFEILDAAGTPVGATAGSSSMEPVLVGPQPQQTTYNWMNIFYAIEWVVFAGFAIYLWWRFLRDDHLRAQEDAELDRRWAREWTAAELERRRAEAREAKQRAVEEYERYHAALAAPSPRAQNQAQSQSQNQRAQEHQ